MLKFEKNVEDRKELVKRLGELTGIRPVYMRTPTYAFQCGDYTVDRDGNLLVDEEAADADILTALMEEGLITGGEVLEDTDGTEAAAETAEMEGPTVETEPTAAEEPAAETEPEAMEALTVTEEDTEQNVAEPQDTEAGDEAQEDDGEIEAAAESEEPADAEQPEGGEARGSLETEGAGEEAEASGTQESDATEEAAEAGDVASDNTDGPADTSEPADGTESEPAVRAESDTASIDLNMAFPIPIGRHTGTSLRNLVNLIYSRGALINKATGGHFSVAGELVEALKDDSCAFSKANFLRAVADYEDQHGKGIYGLTFTPEEIQFTGFGEAADVEHLTAYGQLAVLMNEQALGQKRLQAKEVNITNEKYAMRIWLVRIGMDGPEFKQARAILMENLSGHTAFRTPEDAEKARVKNQKKRDALRAAKAAAEARIHAELPGLHAEQTAEATEGAAHIAEANALMEA